MTYLDVVMCDKCEKILALGVTRHYCNTQDKSKPKGKYGFPMKGEWVD